jgi:hypothetical protein
MSAMGKQPDQWQVQVDPGVWQPQEKRRASVDAPLISAGGLSHQAAEAG